MRSGKPVHRPELIHDSVFSIVSRFQQEYRGFAEYYKLAMNRSYLFGRLKWVMEAALTKTLANKLASASARSTPASGPHSRRPTAHARALRSRRSAKGSPRWWRGGAASRSPERRYAVLDDQVHPVWTGRSELLARLLADACELCGSREQVEVHHVRHLKDLHRRREGQGPPPRWVQVMASRRRKTLVVCRECHEGIHRGDPRAA